MSTNLDLIPHPVLNTTKYLEWEQLHKNQWTPLVTIFEKKIGMFVEAFQSEVAFTKAESVMPIVASYGAGPCVIMGTSARNLGFVAHFSHEKEVTVASSKIIDFLYRNLSKNEKISVELHLRGGILGHKDSEEIFQSIQTFIKKVNKLALCFSLSIASLQSLHSHSEESQSLAIDTRNGKVSSYDPLVDNPDYYRKLTMDDIAFARDSYEKIPAVKVIHAY